MTSSYQFLIESQKLSSGIQVITLLTIDHPNLPQPMRFASPANEVFVSNGNDFLPAFFEVLIASERFDEPPVATLKIAGTDGVILAAIDALKPSPSFTIQAVMETFPDVVQYQNTDFEVISFSHDIASMTIEIGPRLANLPFPGKNMDREATPGIFTNL